MPPAKCATRIFRVRTSSSRSLLMSRTVVTIRENAQPSNRATRNGDRSARVVAPWSVQEIPANGTLIKLPHEAKKP
jgi:hypothetical protein